MRAWLILVLVVIAPAYAAPDELAAYRALAAQDLRLETVGYRLATSNAPFCRKQGYNPGWVIHDIAQYPAKEVARAAFGFEQPVEIAAIVQGGPAEQYGIRAGDGLVAIGDQQVGAIPSGGKPSYQRVAAIKRMLEDSWGPNYIAPLTIQQDSEQRNILFRLDPVCASDFQVDPRSKLDAGADGSIVRVTSGLIDYVRDDDELAAVVAHELAHNILSHPDRWRGLKRGRTRAILATEIEADRLSVWLMANAGYDPAAALRFWQRYGRRSLFGLTDGKHLSWKKRVATIQAEIGLMATTAKQDGPLSPPLLTTD